MDLNTLLEAMTEAVVTGNRERARELARLSVDAPYDPVAVIEQGIRPGMDVIGERFATGEYFLPDLVMGAEATKAALAVLEPVLRAGSGERPVMVRAVIGTVKGDIHEIGKTLVATMLTASGFEVHDLGVDVPTEKFIQVVRETKARLVGLSALLTTTMLEQKRVIEALREAGLREQVRVIVGGAPVSHAWAEEIGADGYADNAAEAAHLARSLLGLT